MFRLPHPHRFLLLGLAVLTLIAALAAPSGARAATLKSCAQQVIDDWFDDGRVNKIYPLPCYTQAIKMLPPDLLIYGNAEEEIGRALAFAKQGKPDPGGKDPTPTQTDTTTEATGTDTTGTAATDTDTTGAAATDTDTTGAAATDTDTSATDTSGPSSVPIPLLVLGGLAVLLLAAGSAGYLRRRMNVEGDGDGPGTPPASA